MGQVSNGPEQKSSGRDLEEVPAAGFLVRVFIFYLFVSGTVAYVVTRTLPVGAGYLSVFQIAGTVAWMAYSFGPIQDAIWFGKPWSHVWKGMADGLLYGLLTGGVFGWQWPA